MQPAGGDTFGNRALGKLVVIDCIPKTERILFTAELGAMPGNTMESE